MSNVTDQCRNTKKLNKLVQIMLAAALAEIKAKGVNPLVIETYRTRETELSLWAGAHTGTVPCGRSPGGVCASRHGADHLDVKQYSLLEKGGGCSSCPQRGSHLERCG